MKRTHTISEDESLDLYLREISRYRPVPSAEEARLAGRIRRGSKRHLEALVKANLRFVVSVARTYQNQGVKLSDLIICCADNDSARLAAGLLASLYLRPLLDIGSGIVREGGGLRMGGDIRLVLPGEGRCLWCFGGVAAPHEALRGLQGNRIQLTCRFNVIPSI